MYRIISPRQGGKTTHLIKSSAETGMYIVCPNKQCAKNIFALAQKLNVSIPYPITIREITTIHGGAVPEVGILIDDLDVIVQSLLYEKFGNVPIHGYAATNNSLL